MKNLLLNLKKNYGLALILLLSVITNGQISSQNCTSTGIFTRSLWHTQIKESNTTEAAAVITSISSNSVTHNIYFNPTVNFINNYNLSCQPFNNNAPNWVFRNVNNSRFWIGRSKNYNCNSNEKVVNKTDFNKRKSDAKESSLALKYGVTLGKNGIAQNYVDSNGTVVWNATVNSGFNYNIAGIGRDDVSNLYQKQSTSSNTNPVITIGLGSIDLTNTANTNTFGSDRQYLVWGDNNGTMNDSGKDLIITFGGSSNVTTTTDLPNKKWKIVETGGDIGTVKIALATSDLAQLPALAGNDAYVMIVAGDEAFTTNVGTVFLTTNGTKQEATYDFDGVQYFTFGVAHETVLSRSLDFNGTDNVVKTDNHNNLSASFSIMFWIKPEGANSLSNDRTIAAKHDGTTGFRMYLSSDNKINASWSGGTGITSSVALPNSEWHNIAVTYNGSNIKLYIDGVLDTTVTSAAPTTNTASFSIGAEYRSKSVTTNHFKGGIDEFRLWNKALSQAQIRFIMNQEIQQNGTKTIGKILPNNLTKNDISTLNWTSLDTYYSMNSFIGTHINDDSNNSHRGNILSLGNLTVEPQTAPMPYQTAADGLWSDNSTWVNGNSQAVPYSLSIIDGSTPIDWNIVRTSHNITTTGNKVVMALDVDSNTLSVNNDSKIQVSHYLKIDGKIDLTGKSQLIQTNNSDLDPASSGSLERDQEGQSNRFNYNYWSSPVSSINSSTINHGFTIAGVMKDGTNPNNIQNINWTSGIDSAPTSPITLSSYWIFKFQNQNNSAANWIQVGQNGTLLPGQGFTLKGSNTDAIHQNYTFIGKPNNGTITSYVGPNNLNLCGNPYPSAIDANDFINDNINTITGTLYFWEHYATNSSHLTIQYQGGYATRTLVGGTPPVSPSGVSGLGSSSKMPNRYIPVGQGFFVTGSATGGNIVFNNNQRTFIKENSSNSYSLFKVSNATTTDTFSHEFDNRNDSFTEEPFMKLRLGFNSPDDYHRQILIGFMNQYATSGLDKGYDAISMDNPSMDMYFINNNNKLNIQGEGYFNENNIYPLGIKTATAGVVKFVIDDKENIEPNQEIYIHDNVTGIYNSIQNQAFEINLPAGTIENRFSLRFKRTDALGVNQSEISNGIAITHLQTTKTISIQNTTTDTTIKSVQLYNLLGQNILTWKLDDRNQTNILLPTTNLSTGAYIVKVLSDKGEVSKKILVK
ncbi:T9SS type A sorting domain-containing protein [Flavobacterium silvisoli]|uniref:T9SS type A sorting domain-containing protein n=1 Tax=Flavobacterium silvisoli TaxID=2529433 RepID=A0A4V2L5H8_9FLAO|nr:LamG-like jellyroll fold domain-containing protein [Flavobacterium silvisoli]TBX70431.1 T9SS type A sorting domain-containing protein [Flavobacterium silvisoli]